MNATGPKNYVPGEDARAPKAKRYVQYDITVVNGTRETFEPTALSYGMSENAAPVGSVIDRADTPAGPGTGGTSAAPSTTQDPQTDQVDKRIAVKGPVEVSTDGTIAWKNGVTASISTPKPFTPSNDRRRPAGAQAVKATLTVTNGSPEPLTSYAIIEASSKDRPAPSLIDLRADVGGFDLAVEPGKKTTIQVAWYALDPSDVVIMVRPDIAYDPGYLRSTGPQKTDAYQPSAGATGRADVALKSGSKFTYQNGVSISVNIAPADRVGSVSETTSRSSPCRPPSPTIPPRSCRSAGRRTSAAGMPRVIGSSTSARASGWTDYEICCPVGRSPRWSG